MVQQQSISIETLQAIAQAFTTWKVNALGAEKESTDQAGINVSKTWVQDTL